VTRIASLNQVAAASVGSRRILRVAVVGMLGTLVDVGLFTVLHVTLGVLGLAANTIAYCAGSGNSFVLHRNWTYSDRPRRATGAQLLKFAAISLTALALNNLLVLWLAAPLGTLFAHPGQGPILAKVCATAVGTGWNFLANNSWTFRETL
jgi:putative flippase GtrA